MGRREHVCSRAIHGPFFTTRNELRYYKPEMFRMTYGEARIQTTEDSLVVQTIALDLQESLEPTTGVRVRAEGNELVLSGEQEKVKELANQLRIGLEQAGITPS